MTQVNLRAFIDSFRNTTFPAEFYQHTIGFDRLFNDLSTAAHYVVEQSSYPPHNIRDLGENQYAIEIAVAGFKPEDLEVSIEKQVLSIKGTRPESRGVEQKYVHRGLALRSFEKHIPLVESIEIKNVELEHGMLTIYVENVVSEKEKRRMIPIKQPLLLEQQ